MSALWWFVSFIGIVAALIFFLGALLTMAVGAISSFYEKHFVDGAMYTIIALVCYWLFTEINNTFVHLLRVIIERVDV